MMAWSLSHNSYIRLLTPISEYNWYYCLGDQFGEPTSEAMSATESVWMYPWNRI